MIDFILPNHPHLDRDYWGKLKSDVVRGIEGMLEDYNNPLLRYCGDPFTGKRLKAQLELILRLRPYVPDLLDHAYEKLFDPKQPPWCFNGYTMSKEEFRELMARLPDPRSYIPRGRLILAFWRRPALSFVTCSSETPACDEIPFDILEGRRYKNEFTIEKLICWGINNIQVTEWIETGEPDLILEHLRPLPKGI